MSSPHAAYFYPPEAGEPWEFVFVAFYAPHALIQNLLQKHGPIFALPTNHPAIRRLLSFRTQAGKDIDMSAADGLRFVAELLAALTASAQPSSDERAAMIQRARRLIQAQESFPWDVNTLAKRLGVSRVYLGRVFRERLGITPSAYLQKQRLRRACELLQLPETKVSQVAQRLGFDTPSHFARAFRRACGLTPGEYQRLGTPALLLD
jgi:AraC-like DNA-binding protein